MMHIKSDLAAAVGNTPLIKLRAASEATGCTILGKAEFMNPGQSVKDRAALYIIKDAIDGYGYGTRREDQTDIINSSGLFGPVQTVEGSVTHTQTKAEMVEAWRSHGTLHRQAGDKFPIIIENIQKMLDENGQDEIAIPYTTRIWLAQLK